MTIIEPFMFQFCTAFHERKQLADKLNEVIDYLNNGGGGGGGDIPTDIQEQIDEIKSRLDDDESDIDSLTSDIASLTGNVESMQTQMNGLTTRISTVETEVNTVSSNVSGLSSTIQTLETQIDNVDDVILNIVNNPTNPDDRRPVLKVTGSGNDPYLRTSKDVAFLDDIPQFEEVIDKPVSGSAFLNQYTYEDSNGFKHWTQDIMVVCTIMSGDYKSIGYVHYKDEPLNFGTWLYIEGGFDQNAQYVMTEWLLPDTPYSSTMYKTKLTFTSSGVSRTSDLNVSFTWKLFTR